MSAEQTTYLLTQCSIMVGLFAPQCGVMVVVNISLIGNQTSRFTRMRPGEDELSCTCRTNYWERQL